jgi:hypothetical protein
MYLGTSNTPDINSYVEVSHPSGVPKRVRGLISYIVQKKQMEKEILFVDHLIFELA